jgi:hypothetical protein
MMKRFCALQLLLLAGCTGAMSAASLFAVAKALLPDFAQLASPAGAGEGSSVPRARPRISDLPIT